ncbi:VWA domain-containing protein [Oxalobacteraceae bacterium R-40]|uniref:VWA domain-containing protein n=1 Tax=Keguizhuia sedimenti TaxID=3064264 RepID=A0ABU1BKL1_9BURK|nr:VWA domain-containing protein [Oxalobacteraceae bacterium R-40]
MPKADDVITDAAQHATSYARRLWQSYRKSDSDNSGLALREVAQRLDLFVTAVFGVSFPIRTVQTPAQPPHFKVNERAEVLHRGPHPGPHPRNAIPATNDRFVWLPRQILYSDGQGALEQYRVIMLQQAMRAHRGSAARHASLSNPLEKALFTLLEAQAADAALLQLLPGMADPIRVFRAGVLARRPPMADLADCQRPIEELLRSLLATEPAFLQRASSEESAERARAIAADWLTRYPDLSTGSELLLRDWWTGDLRMPEKKSATAQHAEPDEKDAPGTSGSAKPKDKPEAGGPKEDKEEDELKSGTEADQTTYQELVEAPMDFERPSRGDEITAATELGNTHSMPRDANGVFAPGRPKEVVLSDEVPHHARPEKTAPAHEFAETKLQYPEWDFRADAYREPGTTVHVSTVQEGPQAWVDQTLESHRATLNQVRRRFEMLRPQRMRFRKQLEGEEIDIDAYIAARADFKAGLPLNHALYQTSRIARRDMAIAILIDISGSTEARVSGTKRVIDIEREASLLVSVAMEGMGEPYCIQAYSGEGPDGVVVRTVKSFEESYGATVARRIASLEPEQYTRSGPAIRHATSTLMKQPARHRLLLLLSDGHPNDVDEYGGRYGVEDMRQAVQEAKLQGVSPFCLTIDRQAADYLSKTFGQHQYALLPKPELLPTVLLDWIKRLIVS